MKLPVEQQRLLADVLSDERSDALRERLLGQTLGLVRGRRRFQQARRTALVLAVVAGLGLVLWRTLPPSAMVPPTERRSYVEVRSRPLQPVALVITRAFDPARVVASVPLSVVVQTAAGDGRVREINDAELLALTGPKPAALVRRGAHSAELVFASPADEEELVSN
jgi:hypothetical protein